MDSDAFQQSGTSPTPWMTAAQAAQYLQIEPRTLLQHARQGIVKGYVLSGTHRLTWRFKQEDLDSAMRPVDVGGKIPSPFGALRARRTQ
jgi:excisionase family DNA binding protein